MTLPDGADPFDFVQSQSGEVLQQLIDAAPDALEHKIRTETANIDLARDTHAANRALENILQTLAHAPATMAHTSTDVRLRLDQLLARLGRQFMVERTQLQQRLADIRKQSQKWSPDFDEPIKPTNARLPKLDNAESELIELLLIESSHIDEILENVLLDEFKPGPLRKIYEHIQEAFHESMDVSFEGLVLLIEDPDLKDLLIRLDDRATLKQQETGFNVRWQLDCVLQEFQRRRMEAGKQQLINRLQKNDMNAQQEEIALVELLETMRQRKSISAPTDG
jgi:DNA primase